MASSTLLSAQFRAIHDSKPFSGSPWVSLRSLSSSLQRFFSPPITPCTTPTVCRSSPTAISSSPIHSAASSLLLAGPLQFSSRFRQRHLKFHRILGRIYVLSVFIGAFTGIALAAGRPGLPGTSMQAAAWIVCTTAAFITARNRQIVQHRQWMARSYAVTFTFVSSRVLNLWPRYWSHLGDTFAAVGVIAFTLASLLLVDLGLNWRELTTRRA